MDKHETAADRLWKDQLEACLSVRDALLLLLGVAALVVAL